MNTDLKFLGLRDGIKINVTVSFFGELPETKTDEESK